MNEHVAGVAQELRVLGHAVTILASSGRAAELAAGRRALQNGALGDSELLAIGPAVPISRRQPGRRARRSPREPRLALAHGRFDVVHGFEPALPSLSYLALREAESLTLATFFSPDRLGYPPGRAQREKLLGRIDVLLATSEETAEAAAVRFPGDYRIDLRGSRHLALRALDKRQLIVLEWRQTERPLLRSALHTLGELPGWRLTLLRTKPLTARPYVPRGLVDRVDARTARDSPSRATILNETAIFVPATHGMSRLALEAAAAGCRGRPPPGTREQPQLATAEMGRLADDAAYRERRALAGRASAEQQTFTDVAHELEKIYESLRGRRRAGRRDSDPLADRNWIVVDLHTHTSASHDCRVPPALLLEHAESEGLGAIAVTDHNIFPGAEEPPSSHATREIVVIPGEEVKTDDAGRGDRSLPEREIPRGMSFGDTIAAIKAQGGLVYLPHPFDRMHAIPDAGDAAPPSRGDRRVRGLQRAPALRDVQRRGAPLRPQVQPDDGRRLRRARAPGRRHGRAADARLRRSRGIPRSASGLPRSFAARSRSCTCSR